MSAEWAVRDEQPILLTSINLCITAGPQGVKNVCNFTSSINHIAWKGVQTNTEVQTCG
jgi:hypothetical protein